MPARLVEAHALDGDPVLGPFELHLQVAGFCVALSSGYCSETTSSRDSADDARPACWKRCIASGSLTISVAAAGT
jgi:hypothetical protein